MADPLDPESGDAWRQQQKPQKKPQQRKEQPEIPKNEPEEPVCDTFAAAREQVVSLKEIPGTPWALALTDRRHEFFYNEQTGSCSWDIPDDIMHLVAELLSKVLGGDIDDNFDDDINDDVEDINDDVNDDVPSQNIDVPVPAPETPKEPPPARPSHQERIEQFKSLLSEMNLSPFSDWSLESAKIEHDDRFKAIASQKERRKIFEEYCATNAQTAAQGISTAHKASQENFQSLLDSKVTVNTGYADFCRKFVRDPRFRGLSDAITRERLFTEHLRKLKTQRIESTTTKKAGDSRSLKEQESLREREEQVRRERNQLHKATNRQLTRIQHDEAKARFLSLLSDRIQTHKADWEEVQPLVFQDPRYPHQFSDKDRITVFNQHLQMLRQKRMDEFHMFLDTETDLTSTFAGVLDTLKTDDRTTRLYLSSDSELESVFKTYMAQKRVQAETTLRETLSHHAFIDFHVRAAIQTATVEAVGRGEKEPPNDEIWRWISLNEIRNVLSQEKPWLVFDAFREDRDRILMRHLKAVVARVVSEKGGTRDKVIAVHAGGK